MLRSFLRRQSFVTGFYPPTFLQSLRGVPSFVADWSRYQSLSPAPTFRLRLKDAFPILTERYESAGTAGGHYFHGDLWAARKIFQVRPPQHVDIGSRIDGFIAHLLTFMPATIVDIRPLTSDIDGLTYLQDDATALSTLQSDSIRSLSSLHVAEHFGLGRYADPIDPDACFKFMDSLQRVLAPGGRLYFSVPIGRERVEFNAHRVFSPSTILKRFSLLRLESFSFVDDKGALHLDTDPLALPDSKFSCGLFEFTKVAE